MKKVINGKRYDTETAQEVAMYQSDYPMNDFNYYCETLYKKKTGEFFLFGEGHGLSKYAHHYGNSSGWGEHIIPLTIDRAKRWAEKLDGDEYEAIFEIEDENNQQISVLIPVSLYEQLKEKSDETNVSQKDIIVEALKLYLGN